MNNRTLGIILIILVAIFLLTKFIGNDQTRSFEEEIIEIDTARVDRIVIHPNNRQDSLFSLEKSDQGWVVTDERLRLPASTSTVSAMLHSISLIQAKQIVARSEDKWEDYEVGRESGVRVEIFDGDKKLGDFILGRLYFNQQTRTALTYLRLTDEEDTYAIEGFLGANISQDFDAYRIRTMIDLNRDDIHTIILSGEELVEQVSLQNDEWISDEGIPIDSSDMARYLSRVSKLYGSEFYNGPPGQLGESFKTMEFRANNTFDPLRVECFYHPQDTGAVILHSSINETGYFKSPDSSGVYKTLFIDFVDLANVEAGE